MNFTHIGAIRAWSFIVSNELLGARASAPFRPPRAAPPRPFRHPLDVEHPLVGNVEISLLDERSVLFYGAGIYFSAPSIPAIIRHGKYTPQYVDNWRRETITATTKYRCKDTLSACKCTGPSFAPNLVYIIQKNVLSAQIHCIKFFIQYLFRTNFRNKNMICIRKRHKKHNW